MLKHSAACGARLLTHRRPFVTRFNPNLKNIFNTQKSLKFYSTVNEGPGHRTNKTDGSEKETSENPPRGKIRTFIRKYGPTGVVVYFAVYFATLFGLFFAIDNDIIVVGDVEKLLAKIGLGTKKEIDDDAEEESKGGLMTKIFGSVFEDKVQVANFGIAWVLTKFTEPIRLAVTVAITPYILKLFNILKRLPK
ncbi:DUF1279 domain-containing protein [Acrasis kona]|uniref:DUF1279 domain-containing protein n=1 Tax=Acrasis kona TaxID=1008807 RepID=A0AAW2ZN43_9EUKA